MRTAINALVQEEKEDISKQKGKKLEGRDVEEQEQKTCLWQGRGSQDSFRFSFVPFYCPIVIGTAEYTLDGFSLLFVQ